MVVWLSHLLPLSPGFLSLCDLKWQSHNVTGIVRIKAWDLATPISWIQPPVPYMLIKETGNSEKQRDLFNVTTSGRTANKEV